MPIRVSLQVRSEARCGLAAAALVAALVSGCQQSPPAAVAPPEVEVVTLAPQDVAVYHEWIGSLEGREHAHVHPQVSGYLIAQNYKEGTLVKKGDAMFTIDPRPFQAVLDQAQARLDKDALDVKRLRPLAEEQAVSQQELDDAVQADLGDKATVEQARLNLEFTRVTAPLDGLAGLANADIGDLVGPTTMELTTISAIDPIKAYFTPSEQEYLGFLHSYLDRTGNTPEPDAQLELLLVDGAVYTHKGRIYAADNQIDVRTGALRVGAEFPNPERVLLPGQFARVRLTQLQRAVLAVPQRAVMELQGNCQVAVVNADNRIQIQPVQMGARAGTRWVVQSGLQAGARVVVEGLQKIKTGQLVSVQPYAPAATNESPTAASPPAR